MSDPIRLSPGLEDGLMEGAGVLTVYYFGCDGRPGHYLFGPGMVSLNLRKFEQPWGLSIDGNLAPHGPQREGVTRVSHKDGWTALSMWDRSVDTRGMSSSTFLIDAELPYDVAMRIAREAFPRVFARFTFEVEEATDAR